MLIKTAIRTLWFLLLILLLSWIPRISFYLTSADAFDYSRLFSFKYLMVSSLFDLKTASYWFGPLLLFMLVDWLVSRVDLKSFNQVLAGLLSISYLVYCFVAIFYYPITKMIVGKEVFGIIGGQEPGIVLAYVLEYWWAVLMILILTFVWVRLLFRYPLQLRPWSKAMYLLLLIPLWVLAARGSVSLKPLNHLDAYETLPSDLAITAMSPAFVLLESFGQQQLEPYIYVSDAQLEAAMAQDILLSDSSSARPNICIILLESFGAEYTAEHSEGQISYTPFLDSLAQHAMYFSQAYANGLRSMDAVASLFVGVPSLMTQPFVGSLYAHVEVASLFEYLDQLGYNSSFYHGADEQSMGFKPFLKAQGLEEYQGKQQYPYREHYDGRWGIFDHFYFKYYAEQLAQKREPWLSTLFSLSSHHPYTVPEDYAFLPSGSLPIHKAVRYTDRSLKVFFDAVKHTEWYDNTLFIITADHSSINQSKQYQTINGKHRVPLVLYGPRWVKDTVVTEAVQHLDILPTILDLVGHEQRYFSFGRSLLHTQEDRQIVHYDGSWYSICEGAYCLTMLGNKVRGLYHQAKDPEHLNDLRSAYPKIADQMQHDLRLRIQNFNHRLIHNRYH